MVVFCTSEDFKNLLAEISPKARTLRLQAKGGSMFPFFRSDDWVEADFLDDKSILKRGDVVLFEKDGYFFAHRILKKDTDCFVTKGDFSWGKDGIIPRSDIVAKVVVVERHGHRIRLDSFSNSFIGEVLTIFHPFFQIFFWCVRKSGRLVLKFLRILESSKLLRRFYRNLIKADIVIDGANDEDWESLRDLYEVSGSDIMRGVHLAQQEGVWLLARWGRKIVGSIVIARHGQGAEFWLMHGLIVKPLARGLGIAEKLFVRGLSEAARAGAKRVGMFVKKNNRPALGLYKKEGLRVSTEYPEEFNVEPDDCYLIYDF